MNELKKKRINKIERFLRILTLNWQTKQKKMNCSSWKQIYEKIKKEEKHKLQIYLIMFYDLIYDYKTNK